jgi:hypothetical protein
MLDGMILLCLFTAVNSNKFHIIVSKMSEVKCTKSYIPH